MEKGGRQRHQFELSSCGSGQWLPQVPRLNGNDKSLTVMVGQVFLGPTISRFCEQSWPHPNCVREFASWDSMALSKPSFSEPVIVFNIKSLRLFSPFVRLPIYAKVNEVL
jgi:hypothetical protein